MARIEKMVCDVCGKEMTDGQDGMVEMLDGAVVQLGKRNGKVSNLVFYVEDICSVQCFVNATSDVKFWRKA